MQFDHIRLNREHFDVLITCSFLSMKIKITSNFRRFVLINFFERMNELE